MALPPVLSQRDLAALAAWNRRHTQRLPLSRLIAKIAGVVRR